MVMLHAVSLPNHTFPGQSSSSEQLTSICGHSFTRRQKLTTVLLESAEGREYTRTEDGSKYDGFEYKTVYKMGHYMMVWAIRQLTGGLKYCIQTKLYRLHRTNGHLQKLVILLYNLYYRAV